MERTAGGDDPDRSRPTRPAVAAQILGIALAPLLLAGLGLTHPRDLTPETAGWWRDLHLLLLPVFPLLGVNLWWLLADGRGLLPWLGRAAGFVYLVYYGALDVLAGIGTGLVLDRADRAGNPDLAGVLPWLFAQGNALAEVGVWAFLVGCVVASTVLVRAAGRAAVPGAVLLCGSAVVFLRSHIYVPVGVATMVAMAAGFGVLQWARLRAPSRAFRHHQHIDTY